MSKNKLVTKKQEMKARAIVQRAINQENAREHEEKSKLVGRCYKYQNRNSSGDPWWLYAVVTCVQDRQLRVTQFEHDSFDGMTLRNDVYGGLLPSGGWQEIDRAEFVLAAAEFLFRFSRSLDSAAMFGAVGQR